MQFRAASGRTLPIVAIDVSGSLFHFAHIRSLLGGRATRPESTISMAELSVSASSGVASAGAEINI